MFRPRLDRHPRRTRSSSRQSLAPVKKRRQALLKCWRSVSNGNFGSVRYALCGTVRVEMPERPRFQGTRSKLRLFFALDGYEVLR